VKYPYLKNYQPAKDMAKIATIKSEFTNGVKDIIPLIIGAIPFGIIFGSLAMGSGLSFIGTLAMSALVFAGASQFIALTLLAAGTSWPMIVLTTFVVNLRHMLYATTLVPHIKNLGQRWKIPLAFWLTDEAFAVVIIRYQQQDDSPYKQWYFLGAALFMYLNWQFCTLLGLTVGQMIPNMTTWGLDFAMVVTFIGMVMPYLTEKPMWATVVVAGSVALLTFSLPHKLGLIVAALAGIGAGILTDYFLEGVPGK